MDIDVQMEQKIQAQVHIMKTLCYIGGSTIYQVICITFSYNHD
jgi:uncharacterized membrane protein